MRFISKEAEFNESIKAQIIRVIDEDGNQVGVLPTKEAVEIARQKGLDLVVVSPASNPPVCKFLNYGQYRYEIQKRDKEAKKKQKIMELKEMRFKSFHINNHDLEVKLRHISGFLKEGDKVKISLFLRGRANVHSDIGITLLNNMADSLSEVGLVERPPQPEGRRLIMVLSPKPQKGVKQRENQDEKERSKKV